MVSVGSSRVRPGLHPGIAAIGDLVAVVAFVSLGRRNHAESVDASGVIGTAAPFLIALAAGWIALRLWRRPTDAQIAVALWAITLTVGMALRRFVFDDGTATAFVIVAAVALATLLIGWRAAWTGWSARRAAITPGS
jgi:hypothetical protein